MGADLSYRCLGNNRYEITLSFYRDCNGVNVPTAYTVRVSSVSCISASNIILSQTSVREVSPLCPNQISNSTCNGGSLPGVEEYTYQGTITLPATCPDWVFAFDESYRNNAINTASNPGGTDIYVEATLDQTLNNCNGSPVFTQPPVPFLCQNQPFVYNHGAVDPDGDSLVYSMVDALEAAGNPVNYISPYNGTNPVASTPAAAIDPQNGTISLTPTLQQVGILAVKVEEFRNGRLIGSTIRDIQLTIIACTNQPPALSNPLQVRGGVAPGPRRIELCSDSALNFFIVGTDSNPLDSLFLTTTNLPAGMTVQIRGNNPDTAFFSWANPPTVNSLYTFFVNLEDNACPIQGSQTLGIEIQVLDGTSAGADATICTGGSPAQLSAIGGSNFTWSVLSGSPNSLSCTNCPNPTANPSVTSRYVVSSDFPCNPLDTITVTVLNGITADAGSAITLCQGGVANLQGSASGGTSYQYQWSPTTNLSNPTIANPTLSTQTGGRYYLTVTSGQCVAVDSVDVSVPAPFLALAPNISDSVFCGDNPVLAQANATNGNCQLYSVSSIPFAQVSGGNNSLTLGDDQVSGSIPIGFDFDFFCNTYSSLFICSNGWLSFTQPNTNALTGAAIPSIFTPNDIIAFAWDDLNPNQGGSISYGTVGLAPNRRFVVTFSQVPHCCSSNNPRVSVQVVLHEGTGVIDIHNIDANNGGTTWVQGIENANGTAGYAVPNRNRTIWSAFQDSWRFAPNLPRPFNLVWQAVPGGNLGSGPTINLSPTTSTDYQLIVTDSASGCADTSLFSIEVPTLSVPAINCIATGDTANLSAIYNGPVPAARCDTYALAPINFTPQTLSSGATTLALSDDQVAQGIPLGFDFDFYCNTYNQAYLSSNGWLTFSQTFASSFTNATIVSASAPNNMIAMFWDDLHPGLGGSVRYQTLGAAPNRRFVVEFLNVPRCCTGSNPTVSGQLVLFESTNIIEVHLFNVQQDPFGDMVIGIEDGNGQNGVAAPNRNNTTFSAFFEGWRFSPIGGGLTYNWTPSTTIAGGTSANPRVWPPNNTWYTVAVTVGNCLLVDSVEVCMNPLAEGWQAFEAKVQGPEVRLAWEADFEQAIAYDIAYRRPGGVFENVHTIFQNQSHRYSWTHSGLEAGSYQYRIQAVNPAGTISQSPIREVHLSAMTPYLYPNPAKDEIHISGASFWSITDLQGRSLMQGTLEEGQALHTLQTNELGPGIYLYTLRGTYERVSGKLIISD
jgi:hypothetical protein